MSGFGARKPRLHEAALRRAKPEQHGHLDEAAKLARQVVAHLALLGGVVERDGKRLRNFVVPDVVEHVAQFVGVVEPAVDKRGGALLGRLEARLVVDGLGACRPCRPCAARPCRDPQAQEVSCALSNFPALDPHFRGVDYLFLQTLGFTRPSSPTRRTRNPIPGSANRRARADQRAGRGDPRSDHLHGKHRTDRAGAVQRLRAAGGLRDGLAIDGSSMWRRRSARSATPRGRRPRARACARWSGSSRAP